MAWHQITYACGHTGRKQIGGPTKDRDRKAEWYGREICPACAAAERAEHNKAAAEQAATEGLAELQGSEKQIAWAESIRREMLAKIDALYDTGKEWHAGHRIVAVALKRITSAEWFINHRLDTIEEIANAAHH